MRFGKVISGFLVAGIIACGGLGADVAEMFSVTAGAVSSSDGKYQYTVSGGEARISKYDGSGVDVTIPSVLDGYAVTAIGASSFSDNSKVRSLIIPDGVKSIGSYAFQNCRALTSVSIPGTVTVIDDSAFKGCTKLNNVSIANGVSTINRNAFEDCASLTGITIPSSVSSIYGANVFRGCRSLSEISVDGGNASYTSENGILYSKNKNTLICCPTAKSDQSFTIPAQTDTIADGAFYGNTSLKSVTLHKGVSSVRSGAFSKCANLAEITVDPDNIRYTSDDGVLYTRDKTILMCYPAGKAQTSFDIPGSVTSLSYDAFNGCANLSAIAIPSSITSIEYAFSGCTGLKNIVVPDSVTKMNGAFEGCTSLESANIPNGITSIDFTFFGCEKLKSMTVPESVTSIYYAFYSCKSLTSVNVPNGVTSLDYAFQDCTSLESVNIPSGVTSVYFAFWNCASLKSVVIPSGISSLDYTFYGCKSLASVTIPNSVTSIGPQTFANCASLTDITFPKSLRSIGNYAFWNCTGLKEIRIPNSVTTIGACAFLNCKNLVKATIPSSVTSIGDVAFNNCDKLVIYGKKGGYVEDYAKENFITFDEMEETSDEPAISGTITVSGGTEAIAGTKMGIKKADGTACDANIEIASDGTFTVTGTLSDGNYTLTASKSKYCPRDYTVTVSGGQMSGELNVRLQLYGDIDNDGVIKLDDAIEVINYFNKKSSVISSADKGTQDYLIAVCDVDKDGVIKLDDAIEIINYFNKKASAFDKIA